MCSATDIENKNAPYFEKIIMEERKMNFLKKIAAVFIALTFAFPVCINTYSADDYSIYIDEDDEEEEETPTPPAPSADTDNNDDYDYEENFVYSAMFSTKLSPTLYGDVMSNCITLIWTYVPDADGYRVYRYNSSKKKYEVIEDIDTPYLSCYNDYDADSMTTYRYVVRAYQKNGSKKVFSRRSNVFKIKTSLLASRLSTATGKSKIRLSWTKNKAADGYDIYYCKQKLTGSDTVRMIYSGTSSFFDFGNNSDVDFKPLKRTSSTSLTIKKAPGYKYYFKMRCYKVVNGKKVYSDFSDIMTSTSSAAMVNGYPKKSKSTVDVVSYRSDINNWTMNISANDKKIMDDFAKKHFTSDMTPYEKIIFVSEYIYSEVQYVYGDDFYALGNLSPVEAVFVKHKGQCYQYNGAFAEFMAYMGYDVRLIAGYRGTGPDNKWSHYWCEICLDGKYYVMDAGNNKDGLYNVFVPYEYASKYMKNGKVLDKTPTA